MKKVLLLLLVLGEFGLYGQDTLYVDQKATGGKKDGSSWDDAFLSIADALKVAKGAVVKVMGGSYLASLKNDQSETLDISEIEAIIGGFGRVNNTVVHEPLLYPTEIDGDIGVRGDSTDNSYELMRCTKLGGKILIEGLTFSNANGLNAPAGKNNGGALVVSDIKATENLELQIENCQFNRNRSLIGGAVFIKVGGFNSIIPTIRSCTFTQNFSRVGGGGGIHLSDVLKSESDSLLITSCIFSANFSGNGGAGIFVKELRGRNVVEQCVFTGNSGYGDGTSIFAYMAAVAKGILTVKNCSFSANIGNGSNFAILRAGMDDPADSISVELIDCNFVGNLADLGDGGAFYFSSLDGYTSLLLENCLFESNKAFNDGGAVYLQNHSNFGLKVNQCKFIGNKAAPSGLGAIFYQAGYLEGFVDRNEISISNTLFAKNRNGIAFNNGSAGQMRINIDNCTFFKNGQYILGKSYSESSDYIDSFTTMNVRNCTIWEPTATISTMFYNGNPQKISINDYFVSNCIMNIGTLKVGNYDADKGGIIYSKYPMFQDTAALNFGLKPCSPAVNKASRFTLDSLGILVDLLGNPRIYQDSVDIGAYESQEKCAVGTSELDQEPLAILLKPNICEPAATIHLELNPNFENYQIKLFDSSGQLYSQSVLMQRGFEAPSAPGFYVVQVFDVRHKIVGVTKLVVVH